MGANYSKFAILHQLPFGDSSSPASIQNVIKAHTKFRQVESFTFDPTDHESNFPEIGEELKISFISREYLEDRIITIMEEEYD